METKLSPLLLFRHITYHNALNNIAQLNAVNGQFLILIFSKNRFNIVYMEDHHEEEGNTKSKTGEVKVKDLLPFFGVCCFIVSCYTALPDCLGAVCENTLCCFNTKAILCKKSKEKEALCKCCSVDIRHRYSIIYFMLHGTNSNISLLYIKYFSFLLSSRELNCSVSSCVRPYLRRSTFHAFVPSVSARQFFLQCNCYLFSFLKRFFCSTTALLRV